MIVDRVLKPILGAKHVAVITDGNESLGGWNHELLGKALCFADEAIFSGDRKLHQKLKGWITAHRYKYRRKFHDPITCRNNNRLIAATNDEIAAYLEAGDRRFFVLRTQLRFSDAQIDAQEHIAFFEPYVEWMAENVATMRRFFLEREFDRKNLLAPPLTDAKKTAILGSNPVLRVVADYAATGVIEGDTKGRGALATRTLIKDTGGAPPDDDEGRR